MAFTPNSFLYRPSNITLRDPQHAARVFTDDQFRLAPKHKFLFHVAFSINSAALSNASLIDRYRNEINVLVKSADLPNFTLNAETLNQYNRKKNIQTTHKYNPINITFHDDNMGLINQLWQNYYSYYYADSRSAWDPAAYKRNATRNSDFITTPYGFDNGSTLPFFNYIKIYQMARHEYVGYTLYNPIITSWNHNKVDYAGQGTMENTMGIQFEAVTYENGDVSTGDPEGFGLEHYDVEKSSLQGNVDSTSSSPSFTGSDTETLDLSIVDTVTQQLNSYQNTVEKTNTNTTTILKTSTTPAQSSALSGIAFPTAPTNTNSTVASLIKLGK
jgi:hypothetical protein